MAALEPFDILHVGNAVGECILWDWRRGALWWTDIQAKRLHRYDWAMVEGEEPIAGGCLYCVDGTRAQTPQGAFPDGAAVDIDGCVWSAHWGASCVVR